MSVCSNCELPLPVYGGVCTVCHCVCCGVYIGVHDCPRCTSSESFCRYLIQSGCREVNHTHLHQAGIVLASDGRRVFVSQTTCPQYVWVVTYDEAVRYTLTDLHTSIETVASW